MFKKILLAVSLLFLATSVSLSAGPAKMVKVVVEPPEASIFINGTFAGYGTTEFARPKKNEVVVIRIEAQEYTPITTKYYGEDKRPVLSFTLQSDGFYRVSAESGIVNKFFTINIDERYITVDESGKRDSQEAWKLIHQILLNYFDEIGTSDYYGGYLQTPWQYKSFKMTDKTIRNRVTVRDISTPERAAYQIKVESEVAGTMAARHGEFTTIDRIPKELEPILSELQTRIGKINNL